MDLFAYSNIDKLDKLAEDNGIKVPRLRGYRLMKNESKINYKEMLKDCEFGSLKDLITSVPRYSINSNIYEYSYETSQLIKKYSKNNKILWNKIHGKFRKNLKYLIKLNKQRVIDQYEMFNKYCGREDVLYIHARVGGSNWNYFNCDKLVKSNDWFLEKVDDSYDWTYCDIYAKLRVNLHT